MDAAHHFLENLALVLSVAALTTVVFQKLRQPVVLGYLLAGLIVGPHVPIPIVADVDMIQALAEWGVILLMFSIGLEFRLGRLVEVGSTAGIVGVVQISIMMWLGYAAGRLFGWTSIESVFAGAILSISSTTIIAKAFEEQKIEGKLRELVFGVLIVEDLVAILLLATLTTVASGSGLSPRELGLTAGRLVAFLAGLCAVGMLIVPRAIRMVVRLDRPETTLVASVGICFATSLLAHKMGYSVALGAFLAGSLVAESGEAKKVEHLVEPVRNMFAAIFFVAVGMLIDPALVLKHWLAIVVLTGVVIVGKVVSVSVGGLLAGIGTRTSVRAGMSLAQIGEFSFIIAGLGLSLRATGEFLYPVAVAVSCLTTLLTPFLLGASERVAAFVDRKMPEPLQVLITLYDAWLEQARTAKRTGARGAGPRRLIRLIALDAACMAGIVIGASLSMGRITALLSARLGLGAGAARAAVVVGAMVVCAPFVLGLARCVRSLGFTLAEASFPAAPPGKLDLAAAPRKALVVTLQLASAFLVGVALLAVTQPFLPPFRGVFVLMPLLIALGVSFWRGATSLRGHVRAGAEVIVEALSAASRSTAPDAESAAMALIRTSLPGLGVPSLVRLSSASGAVGRSLAAINLRGLTGATVVAVSRGETSMVAPSPQEPLRAGDVLAVVGSTEALAAARAVLLGDLTDPHVHARG